MRVRTVLTRFDPQAALECDEGGTKKVTNYVLRGCVQHDQFDIFASVSERYVLSVRVGRK